MVYCGACWFWEEGRRKNNHKARETLTEFLLLRYIYFLIWWLWCWMINGNEWADAPTLQVPLNLWLKRRDDVRAEPELNNNSNYMRIHLHFAKSYLTASKRNSLRVSLIFITMFFFHHFSATKLPRPPWWCSYCQCHCPSSERNCCASWLLETWEKESGE